MPSVGRERLGRLCGAAVLAVVLTTVSACGSDDDHMPPAPAYPRDATLRLNQVQVLGSHNSYHIQPRGRLFDSIERIDAALARTREYTHAPLAEQFDDQGIRQVELDVFADPQGGLYANPSGLRLVPDSPVANRPEMRRPGFKVLHVQDLDFESRCWTFVECLTIIKSWSDAHPDHVPMMVLVEAKDDPLSGVGFVTPIPIGAAEFDALDAEIRSVFPARQVITPDEVRGSHETLEGAIHADGWPTLGAARGRVLFALDNEGSKRDAYVAGHPALRGRVMFTSSPPGEAEAAFVKLNDPIADYDRIRQVVADGFIVRTRADADTEQARTGETTMREAALSSGAQFVSTDYPVPDARFGTNYAVTIPGGMPARCNPVSAPPPCAASDIEHDGSRPAAR